MTSNWDRFPAPRAIESLASSYQEAFTGVRSGSFGSFFIDTISLWPPSECLDTASAPDPLKLDPLDLQVGIIETLPGQAISKPSEGASVVRSGQGHDDRAFHRRVKSADEPMDP
jgi:hypothetical protein